MKHNFSHVVKQAQEVGLSDKEGDDLRKKILNHINLNPMLVPSMWQEKEVPSPYFSFHMFVQRKLLASVFVFLILVSLGGGAAFASRESLPGDLLYGIKRLKEKAALAFTFDTTDRIALQSDLALLRLKEAEELDRVGLLDEEKQDEVRESFALSSDESLSLIKQMHLDSATEAKEISGMKANVEAHGDIVLKLNKKNGKDREQSLFNSVITELKIDLEKEKHEEPKKEINKHNDPVKPNLPKVVLPKPTYDVKPTTIAPKVKATTTVTINATSSDDIKNLLKITIDEEEDTVENLKNEINDVINGSTSGGDSSSGTSGSGSIKVTIPKIGL